MYLVDLYWVPNLIGYYLIYLCEQILEPFSKQKDFLWCPVMLMTKLCITNNHPIFMIFCPEMLFCISTHLTNYLPSNKTLVFFIWVSYTRYVSPCCPLLGVHWTPTFKTSLTSHVNCAVVNPHRSPVPSDSPWHTSCKEKQNRLYSGFVPGYK